MPTSQISTPLNGVPSSTVISALRNHDLMIETLCPDILSYTFVSGNTNSQATYAITDRTSSGQTTYTLTLTNLPLGVDSLVNARPRVGILSIWSKWRVKGDLLCEEVEIDANFMMKKIAKMNVERIRPAQHGKILGAART